MSEPFGRSMMEIMASVQREYHVWMVFWWSEPGMERLTLRYRRYPAFFKLAGPKGWLP